MEEFDIGDIVTYKGDSGWGQQTFQIKDFGIRYGSYIAICLHSGVTFILEGSEIELELSYKKKKKFKQQLEKL